MKVQIVLSLVRESTGSKLILKFYENLNNEQIYHLVQEQYKGWKLDEVITR